MPSPLQPGFRSPCTWPVCWRDAAARRRALRLPVGLCGGQLRCSAQLKPALRCPLLWSEHRRTTSAQRQTCWCDACCCLSHTHVHPCTHTFTVSVRASAPCCPTHCTPHTSAAKPPPSTARGRCGGMLRLLAGCALHKDGNANDGVTPRATLKHTHSRHKITFNAQEMQCATRVATFDGRAWCNGCRERENRGVT